MSRTARRRLPKTGMRTAPRVRRAGRLADPPHETTGDDHARARLAHTADVGRTVRMGTR